MDRPVNVEIRLEVAAGAGRHGLDPDLTVPVGELAGRMQVCHARIGPRATLLNGYSAIWDPPGALDEDGLTILKVGARRDRHFSGGGLRRSGRVQAHGHKGDDQDIHPARAFQRSAFLDDKNGNGGEGAQGTYWGRRASRRRRLGRASTGAAGREGSGRAGVNCRVPRPRRAFSVISDKSEPDRRPGR